MFTLGGTVKGTMEREVKNTETFIGGGVWAAVNVDTFQELKVGANILASSIDDVNYVKNVYAQMQGQITDNYKIGGGLDFKQPLPSQSS